jgi:hypothetical protein
MEKAQDLPKQALAEVFGYPIDNFPKLLNGIDVCISVHSITKCRIAQRAE